MQQKHVNLVTRGTTSVGGRLCFFDTSERHEYNVINEAYLFSVYLLPGSPVSSPFLLTSLYSLLCHVIMIPYSRDYKYPSIIRTPQIQVPI